MAAVLLCRQPNANAVRVSQTSGQAIVTVLGDGVVCYSGDGQATKNYPLGAGQLDFQTQAVINRNATQLHVVVGSSQGSEQYLVGWPADAAGFRTIGDITPQIPLPARAHNLHILERSSEASAASQDSSTASSSSTAVVVLQDGRVGCKHPESVELQLHSDQPPAAKLVASCSYRDAVATVHQNSLGSNALLRLYTLSPSGQLTLTREQPLACPSPSASVVSASMTGTHMLVCWSNNIVSVMRGLAQGHATRQLDIPVPQSQDTIQQQQPQPDMGSTRKRKPGALQQAGSAPSTLLVAPIDETQFLVGRMATNASSSGQPQLCYSLVDCQFGCSIAHDSLPVDVSSTMDPAACSLVADPTAQAPGQLLLRCGGSVFSVHIHHQPANLMSLVGKLALSGSSTATGSKGSSDPAAASATVPALPSAIGLDVRAMMATINAQPEQQQGDSQSDYTLHQLPGDALTRLSSETALQLLQNLLDAHSKQQAPTAKLLQQAVGHILSSHQSYAAFKARVPGGPKTLPQPLPHQLVTMTATGVAEAQQWQALKDLLSVVPDHSLVACQQLLPAVAAAQQYQLLPLVCCKLDDMEPEALVAALQALLAPTTASNLQARKAYYQSVRSCAETAVAHSEQTMAVDEFNQGALAFAKCAAAAVDGFSYQEMLLHAPLAVPVDLAGLQMALRQLSNRQVDRLLAYLAKWVNIYNTKLGDNVNQVKLPQELLFPYFSQVLDWVRAVIDAHLARLLMAQQQSAAEEAQGPASDLGLLQQAIQLQVQACQQLLPLQGAAEHIQKQAPLPAAHVAAATQYTVEYLDLGIYK